MFLYFVKDGLTVQVLLLRIPQNFASRHLVASGNPPQIPWGSYSKEYIKHLARIGHFRQISIADCCKRRSFLEKLPFLETGNHLATSCPSQEPPVGVSMFSPTMYLFLSRKSSLDDSTLCFGMDSNALFSRL